jgi:hypothetical protein
MSTLREDTIRLAYENTGEVQEALLNVLAGDDEDDEKLAITMRRRRTGPGVHQQRRKDRLRKKLDRRNTTVRNREKRLKKRRKNKPRMFRQIGKYSSLHDDVVKVAYENPGVVQDALMKLIVKSGWLG